MESNELNKRQEAIAVFMGYYKTQHGWTPPSGKALSLTKYTTISDLLYSTSMGWLYPVCQKINKMKLRDNDVNLFKLKLDMIDSLHYTEDISEIFIHASDFAMAYNELK